MKLISDSALAIGRSVARSVFDRRGNHSEAHVTEQELAGFLALAAQLGADVAPPTIDDGPHRVNGETRLTFPTRAEAEAVANATFRTTGIVVSVERVR